MKFLQRIRWHLPPSELVKLEKKDLEKNIRGQAKYSNDGRGLIDIANFAVVLVDTRSVDKAWSSKPVREVIVDDPTVRVSQVGLLPFDQNVGKLEIGRFLGKKNIVESKKYREKNRMLGKHFSTKV